MQLIEINLNNTPTVPTTYTYKVKITRYTGGTSYIHYGKFFASAGQSKVVIDASDILWNYRYKGEQTLKPVLSTANNQYEMPIVNSPTLMTDYWYNRIQVEDTQAPARFTSSFYPFFFLPVQIAGYKGITLPVSGTYVPVTDSAIIPHIPHNAPSGFNWSFFFYTVSSGNVKIKKDSSSSTTTISTAANKSYVAALSGATQQYLVSTDGGTTYSKLAVVDQCNKPYYLIWMANNGGMQCQGFLPTSDFTVKYKANTRVDIHNYEWEVNKTDTANWKLKSNNLNDAEYKAYSEIFNSPYLILLDMENSRLHYCITKSTDYKEKRRTRNNTKPFYFEIEVQDTAHLKV